MFQNSVFRASTDTKQWFRAAGVRAVKTMAQTTIAMLPAGAAISQVDWGVVAGTALLSGILSFLTSVVGIPEAGGQVGS